MKQKGGYMLNEKKKILRGIEGLIEKVVQKVEEMVKGGHYMRLVLNREEAIP